MAFRGICTSESPRDLKKLPPELQRNSLLSYWLSVIFNKKTVLIINQVYRFKTLLIVTSPHFTAADTNLNLCSHSNLFELLQSTEGDSFAQRLYYTILIQLSLKAQIL